jgi:hypothetical protein
LANPKNSLLTGRGFDKKICESNSDFLMNFGSKVFPAYRARPARSPGVKFALLRDGIIVQLERQR